MAAPEVAEAAEQQAQCAPAEPAAVDAEGWHGSAAEIAESDGPVGSAAGVGSAAVFDKYADEQ